MTTEECYQKLGGNYSEVLGRMMKQDFIEKFMKKFLEDDSYSLLCDAMEAQNRAEAFRAAHTLKGVCQNLGFGTLASSSSRLTEILRPQADVIPPQANEAMKEVTDNYNTTTQIIREYFQL
ncbi:MAG: Hpt domain-containing protein [Clostridia bacterium]|nr:Hpt domain-containing protein [Clostridia bacterium]MDY5555562.1 Hpt domain-containing protein [Blautia sp.]